MAEQLSASKRMLSGAAVALALAGCSEKSGDGAGQPEPEPIVGYDVSFPQAGQALPEQPSFAIVGLNGTLANNFNSEFAKQIDWAKAATGAGDQPPASIYVHIGNPGSKLASAWPENGKNRYGTCDGTDSLACDYQYGAILATEDIRVAAQHQADKLPVWLDVEPNYSWQKDPARNRAAMEGMVHTFTNHGMAVGIYSDAAIWRQLAGETPADSELNDLPNWVLGAGTMAEARRNCDSTGFTGRVVLAQIADNLQIDRNLLC